MSLQGNGILDEASNSQNKIICFSSRLPRRVVIHQAEAESSTSTLPRRRSRSAKAVQAAEPAVTSQFSSSLLTTTRCKKCLDDRRSDFRLVKSQTTLDNKDFACSASSSHRTSTTPMSAHRCNKCKKCQCQKSTDFMTSGTRINAFHRHRSHTDLAESGGYVPPSPSVIRKRKNGLIVTAPEVIPGESPSPPLPPPKRSTSSFSYNGPNYENLDAFLILKSGGDGSGRFEAMIGGERQGRDWHGRLDGGTTMTMDKSTLSPRILDENESAKSPLTNRQQKHGPPPGPHHVTPPLELGEEIGAPGSRSPLSPTLSHAFSGCHHVPNQRIRMGGKTKSKIFCSPHQTSKTYVPLGHDEDASLGIPVPTRTSRSRTRRPDGQGHVAKPLNFAKIDTSGRTFANRFSPREKQGDQRKGLEDDDPRFQAFFKDVKLMIGPESHLESTERGSRFIHKIVGRSYNLVKPPRHFQPRNPHWTTQDQDANVTAPQRSSIHHHVQNLAVQPSVTPSASGATESK